MMEVILFLVCLLFTFVTIQVTMVLLRWLRGHATGQAPPPDECPKCWPFACGCNREGGR